MLKYFPRSPGFYF